MSLEMSLGNSDLLRQVRLIDPASQRDQVMDIWIEAGQIRAIEPQLEIPDAQVQDCQGLVLAPGLVDLYSHSGEPGFEERETLDSLAAAALAGGFTRLTLLPDTRPALDDPAQIAQIKAAQRPRNPQLNCWGALTLGTKGEQMCELAELSTAGIAGFTDAQPLSAALLRRVMDYGQSLNQPMAFWCCDRALAGAGVLREGGESIRLGLPGIPTMAETAPLAALLECVAEIGMPVHLMRISTARSVELIGAAKAAGLPITASVSWMHLLLDVTAAQSYDPSLHLDPPLGNPTDRAALVQGLQTGVLDAIAVDHSPYSYEEKTVSFAESPPGAIGLELVLPLLWQAFVEPEIWSALDLWRWLSLRPAECLRQAPAQIAVGATAELVLFDPKQQWRVSPQTLKSRSANTPWLGKALQGRVVKTWC
ncbi:MAG: dihydroorotase [Pegethrix bostrychoides GSE-TBD4-15B]|uniref:Dihydroorotase n=1 Tax=Pegethrix bostrychoides GSE-TBD4-15B TaxID=2839662 RepID=A0A951U4W0_9CYAN|nr:dihydroorotase [Pegethrix bostrychoides GSE-TBD4-15B]